LDQTGGAAAFISVALTPTNSSEPTRSNSTDAFGGYPFSALPPGSYILSVELPGFKPYEQQLSVNSGATLTQDILLELTQSISRASTSSLLIRISMSAASARANRLFSTTGILHGKARFGLSS
jgi:hypothetical protein